MYKRFMPSNNILYFVNLKNLHKIKLTKKRLRAIFLNIENKNNNDNFMKYRRLSWTHLENNKIKLVYNHLTKDLQVIRIYKNIKKDRFISLK